MQSLVEAARAEDYPAEICLVVSDKPGAPGLTWASQQAIPALALDRKLFSDREHFEGQLHSVLSASRIDLICLAGFMRLLSPEFVTRWHDKLLNIHPSLLPAFKGLDTHQRALAAGVKFAGCTVHLVRPEMDEGPILGQAVVPVRPDDTADVLGARVLAAEHRLYPSVLRLFVTGALYNAADKASTFQHDEPDWVHFSPIVY